MDNIEIIDITSDNLSEYGFCGLKKPSKTEGYKKKREWMMKQFQNGMRFKVIQSKIDGTIAFIEYIPGEYSWRAIDAKRYMVIHCLMSYVKKYQKNGNGSLLINACLEDAISNNMDGVAVVTSGDSFMADKDIFLKNGFISVDSAPPEFELLVKRFNNKSDYPKFKGDWDNKINKYKKGLSIVYSDQCPMIIKWVNEMVEYSKDSGIITNAIELKNCKEAQNSPSAYGTFAIIYNGRLIASRPISGGSFIYKMQKLLSQSRP